VRVGELVKQMAMLPWRWLMQKNSRTPSLDDAQLINNKRLFDTNETSIHEPADENDGSEPEKGLK